MDKFSRQAGDFTRSDRYKLVLKLAVTYSAENRAAADVMGEDEKLAAANRMHLTPPRKTVLMKEKVDGSVRQSNGTWISQ